MTNLAVVNKVEDLEFKWGKKRGVGGKKKEVQFYDSFSYDGVHYTLYDCVYLYKEGEPEPYIGKLIKIWENRDKSRKVKVQWFFRPSEISNWLGDEWALENEIFLASGQGIGLANVNPLEAIAGKCNVVCISKDMRNPQPSVEELQMADYIFYRTFDVGSHTILGKMDNKVSGLEVKFIFNQKEGEIAVAVSKLGSDRQEYNNNDVACSETLQNSRQNPSVEFKTVKTAGNYSQLLVKEDADVKNLLVKQEHLPGGIPVSVAAVDSIKVPTTSFERGIVPIDNFTGCKGDSDKDEVKVSKVPVDQVEVEERTKFSSDTNALNNRPSKKARVDSSVKLFDDKDMSSVQKSTVLRNDAKESVPAVTPSGENTKTGNGKDSIGLEKKVKNAKDSSGSEDRPSKKARVDGSVELFGDKSKKSSWKLSVNSNGNEAMDLVTSVISAEEKTKSRLSKDSLRLDKGLLKKEMPDEKTRKFPDDKLPKVSAGAALDEDRKMEGQLIEVTRRPDADKSKWFRPLPWEERMQGAYEQGTLVLLQNLDPEYTSGEVEDIIWHAFKEICTAKMVQRTATSSRHSGQAFVIFKTRDAAERIVKKLKVGCLMLSDRRPLVGCVGHPPSLSGKLSTFFGHLSIDKIKLQMQREMKEAVSTSHCSQPNTIEYEMAMEWCLLQTRSDSWWKRLYKQQGEELRKLRLNLKSK